jgi:hypothetical protein
LASGRLPTSQLLLPLPLVPPCCRCCSYGRLDYCLDNAGVEGVFALTADHPVDEFDKVCMHAMLLNTVSWHCLWLLSAIDLLPAVLTVDDSPVEIGDARIC